MGRGTKTGACAWCKKITDLQWSHSIPKCFLKVAYHNGQILSASTIDDMIDPTDDVGASHLLCSKCEIIFGRFEAYTFNSLNKMTNEPRSKIFKIDNTPLRQFVLGCAWKCSLSGSDMLRHYKLETIEEKYVENSLRIELEEDKTSGLAVSVARLIDRNHYAPDFMRDGAIYTPFTRKIEGITHIWFSLNEFVFELALSPQSDLRIRGEDLFYGRRRLGPKKIHFLEHPFVRSATMDSYRLHRESRYTPRAEKWLHTRPN